MNKKQARINCFEKLSKLEDKKNRDLAISKKLLKEFKGYTNIGVYMPIRNECVLELGSEFKLCYPRVIGKEMKFFDGTMGFTKSKFGIEEPISDNEVIPDLIIAPCVGYYKNYRLGYGGGFYDRYLEKHDIVTIGIAYKETELDSLEMNEYDLPMDKILLI